MVGFADFMERNLLDHFLSNPPFSPYNPLYLGLSTSVPTDSGSGFTEPSLSGGYARLTTTGADWDAATGSSPCTKALAVSKKFPTAIADWAAGAPLVCVGLFGGASGGLPMVFGPLATPRVVLLGDTVTFLPNSIVLKLGDPNDNF